MANKFSVKSRESTLGRLADEVLQGGAETQKLSNELDFAQSPTGLNIHLYPVQRVVLKALFGIPMDYGQGEVPVWDLMHTKKLYTFTDTTYLKWVHEQGRCNFGDWRDLPSVGFHTFTGMVGRRGGKSALVSAIVGCKLRNLLAIKDPQGYYNLIKGSRVDFTLIGTDSDSSGRLFKAVSAAINGAPYFAPYIQANNTEDMQFVTEADRDRPDAKPSIQIVSLPCTTRSARGPSSIVLALDEFCHFRSSKDANSDDLYSAASPSTSNFANPEHENLLDSKTLLISSPWTKSGKMYEVFQQAMDDGISSEVFAIRCSTSEMNHRITNQALQKELKDNPDNFKAEFGGEFIDGTGSYIPSIKFDPCIDLNRTNKMRFDISAYGRKYFWWVDLGMKNDATGLAIGHLELVEGSGIELIFDYIDRMMVGEDFKGPGVENPERIKDLVELETVDILAWMKYMNDIFPCHAGGTDQHGGTMLKQSLHIQGMNSFEYYHSTADLNSKMAFALKGFIDKKAARFPNEEKFLAEFRKLEATWVNKYTIKVQAPNEKGCHDDMSDAVQGVAWLAEKWLEEDGMLDQDPSGKTLQSDQLLLNPAPIADVGSVSIRDLTILSRMQKIQSMSLLPPQFQGMVPVKSPFGRRR